MKILTISIPSTSIMEPSKASVDIVESTSSSPQHLPPDLVSTSSCSAIDDNISDISEVDARELLQEQDENNDVEEDEDVEMRPKSPRSIFSDHWSRSGTEPISLKHAKELKRTVTLPADWKLDDHDQDDQAEESDDDTAKLYERSISQSEDKLFPNASLPTLRPRSSLSSLVVRASTSDLLRPKKLSSCFKTTATSNKNHVKFAPNVDILEYKEVRDLPSTNEGWSKYFH